MRSVYSGIRIRSASQLLFQLKHFVRLDLKRSDRDDPLTQFNSLEKEALCTSILIRFFC